MNDLRTGLRPAFAELRQDTDLPYVELEADDSVYDPEVQTRAAELTDQFLRFKIPGIGIRHHDSLHTNSAQRHQLHGSLLLAACNELGVSTDGVLVSGVPVPYIGETPAHEDSSKKPVIGNRLGMNVRLHTAGLEDDGAHVTLASSRSTLLLPGDHELFTDEMAVDGLEEHDYGAGEMESRAKQIKLIDLGSYEPNVSEPLIYHFDESPGSSVVICSRTALGPTTIHSFEPMSSDPGSRRYVLLSMLTIKTQ